MRQALRQLFMVSNVIPLLLAILFSTTAATGLVDLESKIASIVPSAEEDRWLDVPWHTNLMHADLSSLTSPE
jgi:hypothetical protein